MADLAGDIVAFDEAPPGVGGIILRAMDPYPARPGILDIVVFGDTVGPREADPTLPIAMFPGVKLGMGDGHVR